ncbi:MAG: NADH pyrophosphatase, partial [Pseudoruegeria sp.]
LSGSQPWPFPHSIMVGAVCDVLDPTIKVDTLELEDCRWFTRDETSQIRADSHPKGFRNTSKNTLAARLIDDWLNG